MEKQAIIKKIEVRPDGSRRVFTINNEPSKTDQSQKKACDINNIIARYRKTGQLNHVTQKQGLYQDLSEIPDLMGAFEQVAKAADAFEALPAHLRKRLNNDPQQLIEYLNDPRNTEESIKLGLRVKPASSTVPSAEEPSVSAVETPPASS